MQKIKLICGFMLASMLFFSSCASMVNELPGDCLSGKCRNGHGVFQFENGDIYEGYFSNGMTSGFGIMKYNNGDIYEGMWSYGRSEGTGSLWMNDGSQYRGSFLLGNFHGSGELTTKIHFDTDAGLTEQTIMIKAEWRRNKIDVSTPVNFSCFSSEGESVFEEIRLNLRNLSGGSHLSSNDLLSLMLENNATMTMFSNYYQQRVKESVSSEVGNTGLGKLITTAAGGLASIGADQFKRSDFKYYSLYTMTIGNEIQEQYLNILGEWIQLKGRQ